MFVYINYQCAIVKSHRSDCSLLFQSIVEVTVQQS